ncbi:thiamine diphosphokinase [Fodinibius saliphilus]|uniref:thiamine diphosphokinase n=1 Tax=Fodinibius saliphilus TaxID=1920650 RepID=UPI001109BFEB|nr:thiamine diphosphokinase [Fodinibius saliphilus]
MKKVLILCNGSPPSRELFRESFAQADYFIAADGGGNIARQFSTQPDVVIGDLDSYKPVSNEPFKVVSRPNQEYNDLEKALTYADKEGGTHIHVLGATGYRLDQTLKNLSVLKQFNSNFQSLVMKDNYGDTQLITPTYETELAIGTTVSLFPLSGTVTGITTHGLKYPLENESLTNGIRDGSSNEVIKPTVEITYQSGDLLLFVCR